MVEISDLVITVAELVSLWIVVSIPLYLVARVTTHGNVNFSQTMGATVTGGIAYGIVLVGTTVLLGAIIGAAESVSDLALFLAFIAWLAVFHSSFRVGWLAAAGISVLSLIVFLGLNALLGVALGLALPSLFQFPL